LKFLKIFLKKFLSGGRGGRAPKPPQKKTSEILKHNAEDHAPTLPAKLLYKSF
jgi:hypothetical protein